MTEAQKRHLAARAVAANAADAAELAELLGMLGLTAQEGLAVSEPEPAPPRRRRRSVAQREAARTLSSTLLSAATGH
ncbi:hypothetical protein [Actinokineospora sp. HUAS TT18]|uniref:hypothetical protein n=1 Tax=Actinokineospora sp. HUAS TT18 TaxID=3447451 RepID=UPI003F522F99